jgi:endonuclease I
MQRILLLFLIFGSVSCVKKDFDDPPIKDGGDLEDATMTIAELKKMYTDANQVILKLNSGVIKGQIISSDAAGNIYKEIYLQDASSGILVRIDQNSLYTKYKLGAESSIKLDGMVLGNYGGNIQLGLESVYNGSPSAGQIPAPLAPKFIQVGEVLDTIETLTLSVKQIRDAFSNSDFSYVGRKVLIKNIQHADQGKGITYADAVNQAIKNRYFNDGSTSSDIILRNSGYSDFAGEKIPDGKGQIWAIVSVFNGSPQLYINDPTTDMINFTDDDTSEGGDNNLITPPLVQSVFEDFNGTKYDDISASGWNNYKSEGSSRWFYNEFSGNSYANISVYKANEARTTWLISPKLDVVNASDKTFSFVSREEFRPTNGAIFKVLISSDFDGSAAPSDSKYTWTEINPTLSNDGATGYGTWTNSGNFDLTSYGNVVVAFYYEGEEGVKDGGFSIDDFKFNTGSGNSGGTENYYSSTTGKTGFELKTELFNIISNGTVELSYTPGLWDAYSSTDDKYGQGNIIWDIYSDIPNPNDPETPDGDQAGEYEYTIITDQCGNFANEGDCYNREHTFPKSWFADAAPMYTDLIQVLPTDGKVNGQRGNHPYGEVSTASWTSINGSKVGISNVSAYTGTVFEPNDEYKGDVARIYFYMATRYQDKISLWETNSDNANAVLDGTSDKVFEDWQLIILKKWHNDDPVSQKEIERNDAVFAIQKNRNPYVDHPEWVGEIWGN